MKRNGFVLAGGIVGTIRGALGILLGFGSVTLLAELDAVIPGAGALIGFEFVLSIAVLAASIWAIVKSSDPAAAPAIKTVGVLVIVAGFVDLLWAVGILGLEPQVLSSAFGSVTALSIIGLLFVSGANLFRVRAAAA